MLEMIKLGFRKGKSIAQGHTTNNLNEWQDEVEDFLLIIEDSPQVSYIISSPPLSKPILFFFFFFFVFNVIMHLLGIEPILIHPGIHARNEKTGIQK